MPDHDHRRNDSADEPSGPPPALVAGTAAPPIPPFRLPSPKNHQHIKRVFDVALVVASLPLSLPLAALICAYLWLLGGPVLFVQLRRGHGKVFRILKFCTMRQGGEAAPADLQDTRILPGRAFLRRLRLDELPQLWNVLAGEMSLVGPRPEALELARRYERELPGYRARLEVLPGLTGWAQIRSGYTANAAEAAIKLADDLYYIRNASLRLDIWILLCTIRIVLLGKGR